MTFAYIKESHLLMGGSDEWISVLVVNEAEGIVIAGDEKTYEVERDALVDAQEWILGDPVLAIFGDEETLKYERPDDWQDLAGKTRFHRLAMTADYFTTGGYEYGEVMWR